MQHPLPNDIRELGQTPLFGGLSKRELERIQRLGTVVDRGPGESLCRAEQSEGQLGIVVTGELVATAPCGCRRYLRRGDWFGSTPCSGCPGVPEEIETVTAVTVFVMSRRELASIRNVCPALATRLEGLGEATVAAAYPVEPCAAYA
jgi:hypothetical protein